MLNGGSAKARSTLPLGMSAIPVMQSLFRSLSSSMKTPCPNQGREHVLDRERSTRQYRAGDEPDASQFNLHRLRLRAHLFQIADVQKCLLGEIVGFAVADGVEALERVGDLGVDALLARELLG